VLKALRSPSRSLRNFSELRVARPWEAITSYDAPLPQPESFEVYPNRDSYPFVADYRFDPEWKLRDFVRGTIRLNGWAEAWTDVFSTVESLEGAPAAEVDAKLTDMANGFLKDNSYAPGEPDRVVLFVSLRAERDGKPVFHETWAMDAWGDARGSAMGRLVSVPVSLGIEAVLARSVPVGVHPAPHDPKLIAAWLAEVGRLAQYLQRVDHLA
jgi:saccharopine dehydrogenase (NADP+, L-glutamate forming)